MSLAILQNYTDKQPTQTPFLSIWVHACCHISHVRLSETLSTVACRASLSMKLSRQEHWSGLPCPPPGDLPNPGMVPMSLMSPASGGGFLTTSATWEVLFHITNSKLTKLNKINTNSQHIYLSSPWCKSLQKGIEVQKNWDKISQKEKVFLTCRTTDKDFWWEHWLQKGELKSTHKNKLKMD